MQDRGDEEVDLERMSDGYESDESPLPPVDNPCNGLKRQENIGNAQVFQSKPKTGNQGKFQLWSSDALASKPQLMKNCAPESLQRSLSQNTAGLITSQSVAPSIEIKPTLDPRLNANPIPIKVNFNNSLP